MGMKDAVKRGYIKKCTGEKVGAGLWRNMICEPFINGPQMN
jgi:hypothetical protein